MEIVFLSRRNLLTLLSKLDRNKNGDSSSCTLVKKDNVHPKYQQSMPSIAVIAIEDDEYYADRKAGAVHPADESILAEMPDYEFILGFLTNQYDTPISGNALMRAGCYKWEKLKELPDGYELHVAVTAESETKALERAVRNVKAVFPSWHLISMRWPE